MPFLVLKTKCSQNKTVSIIVFATRVADTHYLPHNHHLILSSSNSKMVCRQWSLSSRFTGTWQIKCDKVAETLWGPSGSRVAMRWYGLGEPCGGKAEPGCGCWQWGHAPSCPSQGHLEAEGMTHGAAFQAAHITSQPLRSWKEARGRWEFPDPEGTLRMKEVLLTVSANGAPGPVSMI